MTCVFPERSPLSSALAVPPIAIDGLIKPQVPLAPLTTYRVGGVAEWLAMPRTVGDLQTALAWAKSEAVPVTFLGAGSNLLVSDRGLPGLILCTRHLKSTQFDAATGQVTAGAGKSIVRLSWQVAERGWQGMEWAVGIPGTVGGAVVMNAGAHQFCTADILLSARVLTTSGESFILLPEELGYRYRTSVLQDSPQNGKANRIVVEATFQLQPSADPTIVTALTREHLERRHSTQPYHLPSCGSVFRNPSIKTAGWLVEQSGLKGYRIGGAQVSPMHANFIVNTGGATAMDVLRLIRHVQKVVGDRWQVHLEPEVKLMGEFEE